MLLGGWGNVSLLPPTDRNAGRRGADVENSCQETIRALLADGINPLLSLSTTQCHTRGGHSHVHPVTGEAERPGGA